MQGFGYFFRQIKYNFIYFTRIDSGYARIRRYVSALNRRAARLGKKISAFAYAPQNATILSKGPFRGGGRRYKKIPHMQMYAGFFCYLTQSSQHFDAINRPVRYFLDACADTRNVEQQECEGHETGHPNHLPKDLFQRHSHNALAQS